MAEPKVVCPNTFEVVVSVVVSVVVVSVERLTVPPPQEVNPKSRSKAMKYRGSENSLFVNIFSQSP